MKSIFIIFCLVFAVSLLAADTAITFEKTVHDFGNIQEEDGPYEIEFKFTNRGDEAFRLTKVKAG